MLRILVGIFFIVHGLIHLFGFLPPWNLGKSLNLPHSTTVLDGRMNLGEVGARLVGLLWLAALVGYLIAAFGLFQLAPWWQPLTLWTTLLSLGLCILGWPDAKFGVLINLILLAWLFYGPRLGWMFAG